MKNIFLLAVSTISIVLVFLMPPMSQDVLYHQFADQRMLLGVPHLLNVLSNLPFLIVGYLGYNLVSVKKEVALVSRIQYVYRLFFLSVFWVGLGSSYYHLSPDNSTLLWDRLPMVVAFMSFFTIVLAEYVNEKMAARLFLPLLMAGVVSVFYWYWSEMNGQGDLRMYIIIQFLPIIIMPLIFLLNASRFNKTHFFWLVLACYGAAKGLELMDESVFELTALVSGHSLKHLLSALGPFMFYLALKKREAV